MVDLLCTNRDCTTFYDPVGALLPAVLGCRTQRHDMSMGGILSQEHHESDP